MVHGHDAGHRLSASSWGVQTLLYRRPSMVAASRLLRFICGAAPQPSDCCVGGGGRTRWRCPWCDGTWSRPAADSPPAHHQLACSGKKQRRERLGAQQWAASLHDEGQCKPWTDGWRCIARQSRIKHGRRPVAALSASAASQLVATL